MGAYRVNLLYLHHDVLTYDDGCLFMSPKVVAILETRTGVHLGELIARRGAIPMLAPALEEVPEVDPGAVTSLLDGWHADPFKLAIFQTGVGTRALFQATDALARTDEVLELLAGSVVAVRGPKPTAELNARRVRIDIRAPSPFTTDSVLESLAGIELERTAVLVQRYGATNQALRDALEARGATVREIAMYRWALPADTRPLRNLIDALAGSRVDAVVFTSAVQVQNLFAVAAEEGRSESLAGLMKGLVIASIGPVCSRALRSYGITPSFEASPPKLGPLVAALESALNGTH
jgi:uroporphyrinogen-III synthase